MKASDVTLILTTTGGRFSRLEVPGLYVQIQTHRAALERKLGKQLSFREALYSWNENIFLPIINEVEDDWRVQRASVGKTVSETYFEISSIAEEDGYKDIPGAVACYVEENGRGTLAAIVERLLMATRPHRMAG